MARSFRAACGAAVLVGSFVLSMTAPAAGVDNPWSPAPSMATARADHTATLLGNGEVLLAGGQGPGGSALASCELYDPTTNTWSPAASMAQARFSHTATLLGNGKVLVVGGRADSTGLASAELYDPATNTWWSAGSMTTDRADHTATLLENGEVLVAGGTGGGSPNPLATAELYDPATNTWLRAASMRSGHDGATATLLGNGRVRVAGSFVKASARADIYDPAMNKWFVAAPMADDRSFHTATLLGNGKVLVAGGDSFPEGDVASAELYDPATNTWSSAGSMTTARDSHTATLLGSGKVLVAGGYNFQPPNGSIELDSAELFELGASTVEESDLGVQYDGWVGYTDPSANGGAYRASKKAKDTVKFTFAGTSMTWVSRSGPDRGMASVTIGGVSEGTFDLYTPSPGAYSVTFVGLANAPHAIVVKVLGAKNAASTDTGVPVDAFTVGAVTTQESSPSVKLGNWAGQSDANASGGTYRISGTAGAQVTLPFTGTAIDWVTALGPVYGQAQVLIDGVSKGTVDLYQAASQWKVLQSYTGLSSGPHTIVVKVTGTKNTSSTGTGVVVDAFVVHP